jgi:hypothetical protein
MDKGVESPRLFSMNRVEAIEILGAFLKDREFLASSNSLRRLT